MWGVALVPFLKKLPTRKIAWVGVWLLGVFLLCSGTWGSDVRAGEDVAVYIEQMLRTLDGGAVPVRGYYSGMDLGHPGPVLYWVLIVGGWLGRAVGASPQAGAVIAYAGACVALMLLAGRFVIRGTGSFLAGVGVVVVAWWLAGYRESGWEGPADLGIHVWPIYGPSFGGLLLLAGIAAGCAAIAGDRRSAWWAIILSGLAIQANASYILDGLIILIDGVWVLRKRSDMRRLASALFLGYGVFVARMIVDGLDFPLRYVQQLLAYNDLVHGSWEKLSVTHMIASAWGYIPQSSVLLMAAAILVGILAILSANRRFALYLLFSYTVAMFVAVVFVVKMHHMTIVTPFMAFGIGAGGGVVVERLCRVLLRKKHTIAVGVGVVAVGACLWATSFGYEVYRPMPMPGTALWAQRGEVSERLIALDDIVANSGAADGDVVEFLSTSNTPPDLLLDVLMDRNQRAELHNAFTNNGTRVCYKNSIINPEPSRPIDCSELEVDLRVVFTNESLSAGTYLGSFLVPKNGEETAIRAYMIDEPAEVGFTWCELGSSWMPNSQWWRGPSCGEY